MTTTIGKKIRAIAEGYVPSRSKGPKTEMTSHETICVLNANKEETTVSIRVYFDDQDRFGLFVFSIGPQRTLHIRFNALKNPEPIPEGKDSASVVESSLPVVVQHTRLDSRQSKNALMTTMAYAHSD